MGEIVTKEQFTSPSTRPGPKLIFNCLPSPKQSTDWRESGDFAAAGAPAPVVPVNYSNRWDAVESQGETGSCVGWACASLIEYHAIQAGRIGAGEKLSARYLWVASKEMDENMERPTTFLDYAGTTIKQALSIARNYGVVSEVRFPFQGSGNLAIDVPQFYQEAARLRIDAYYNLNTPAGQVKAAVWKSWLTRGPIVARLLPDDPFCRQGDSSILQQYLGPTQMGGHAVVVAGWDANGFIMRNSWGTGWGQGGYRTASVQYIEAAFSEAYAISISRQAPSGMPQPA